MNINRIPVALSLVCATVIIIATTIMSACQHSQEPTEGAEFFVPGVSAAGVLIAVDDTNAVKAKIGPPEIEKRLQSNGVIWIYPSRGMAIQFSGLSTPYKSPLETDSTVVQIVLFSHRPIDTAMMEMCTLRSREGITLQSTPVDFVRLLGDPPMLQLPVNQKLTPEATCTMLYPGMLIPFNQGKISQIILRYFPPTDTALMKRIVDQPIVAGKTAAGVSLGMTPDQVFAVLGPTKFKAKKTAAEFWFYPQYGVKVQFGIPPIEQRRSKAFLDTTYINHVTGITTTARTFFDGEATSTSYTGATPEGLRVGQPIHRVLDQYGDPFHFATEMEAFSKSVSMFSPPGSPVKRTGMNGRYPLYLYDGIAFFENMGDSTIHHIMVTYSQLPLEEAL